MDINPNENGPTHQSLKTVVANCFEKYGDTIRELDQTSGQPALYVQSDDGLIHTFNKDVECETVTIELINNNASKPANILSRIEDVSSAGRHAIVVCTEKSTAKICHGYLAEPYQETTRFGVAWYNTHEPVQCPDGRTPVVETQSTSQTIAWETNSNQAHRLTVDGETQTTGEPGQSVGDLEYEYYSRRIEDGYRIETSEGKHIEEYESKAERNANWTPIAAPYVAPDIEFEQFVTVTYYDADFGEIIQVVQ